MYAVLLSAALVFVAELGDKSQLMALTFATRYRPLPILAGIALATALVHAVSVAIGVLLDTTMPTDWITLGAAIAFFAFAAWTARGDQLSEGDAMRARRSSRSAFLASGTAFFLAELGDKTMLATVALASDYHWAGVWIGATIGMVLADGVAIAAGVLLHRRLPEGFLHGMASVLFALFGLWLLFDGALELRWVAVATTGAFAVSAITIATFRYLRSRRAVSAAPEPDAAPIRRSAQQKP